MKVLATLALHSLLLSTDLLPYLLSSFCNHRTFLYTQLALTTVYTMTLTSDSDGRIFFSSSPTRYSSGPAEEVDTVLAQVQKNDRLDPVIKAIVTVNQDAFFETFSRRVELIKSRSQAFQDCHVTIFDKVLLILTQNGRELGNAAAISYFCEEHLGIPSSAASTLKRAILSDALIAPAGLGQGMK